MEHSAGTKWMVASDAEVAQSTPARVTWSSPSHESGNRNVSCGRVRPSVPKSSGSTQKPPVQAQVKPVQDRIAGTKSFLERARKRVVTSRQEVEKAREALATAERKLAFEEDGVLQAEGRLSALQQEATTVPADFALELTRLQSFVQEFWRERCDLRAQVAAQSVVSEDRPRKTNRSQHRRQI